MYSHLNITTIRVMMGESTCVYLRVHTSWWVVRRTVNIRVLGLILRFATDALVPEDTSACIHPIRYGQHHAHAVGEHTYGMCYPTAWHGLTYRKDGCFPTMQ